MSAKREDGSLPHVSRRLSHDSEWKAFGAMRYDSQAEGQRLLPHPEEAKVVSRGFYVPRNLLPQSFH